MKFSVFYQQALARKGGEQALKSLLPPVTEKHRLAEIGDDRYLSEITRCIFKAGFVWRVIENKWPDFEAAFEGFVPAYWQQVPAREGDPHCLDGPCRCSRRRRQHTPSCVA